MKLEAPTQSIDFEAYDMHGEKFTLKDYRGKSVILSFFRNTNCPFCLKRVFELATYQKRWRKNGIEVITVFSSPAKKMHGFRKSNFQRFRIVPDPDIKLYKLYGIEKSFSGLVKGLVTRLPTVLKGFSHGAKVEKNPHGLLLPADFLIDPEGQIVEAWYGTNAADNIQLDRILKFVDRAAKDLRAAQIEAHSTRED